jgi:2-C-methyl-D-erythritol 4-phosphate cytidylyltransferase
MIDVVVLAAGKGERMNSSVNKMFHEIDRIPVLYRTLARLNEISNVNRIVVIIQEQDQHRFEEMTARFGAIDKIEAAIQGGQKRSDSVRNGLQYILQNPASDIVMTHDGARPFFSSELVQCLETTVKPRCIAIPALSIFETIRQKKKDQLAKLVDRDTYFTIQTPQAFEAASIDECFLSSKQALLDLSDEAAYFEEKGYSIELVKGEKWNIKITNQEDIIWGELLLSGYPELRLKAHE